MKRATVSTDGETITVHIPLTFRKRGGRKLVVTPDGAEWAPRRAKGVNATYVSRVLRLTLLAPQVVEAILDGRQPAAFQLDDLLEAFPLEWEEQQVELGFLA